MTASADPTEFIAVQYDAVAFDKDAESGRVSARRVQRWTTEGDFVRWEKVPPGDPLHELTPEQVLARVRVGHLRQGQDGSLYRRAGALTVAEALARLHKPVTDAELAALNARLDAEWLARHHAQRPCCPDCWNFNVQRRDGLARCRCGWKGKEELLHRRPTE